MCNVEPFTLFYCLCFVLGPQRCQNFDQDFKTMGIRRHFSLTNLDRKLANGTVIKREWVIFSPALEAVFCFPCRLFGNARQQKQIESFREIGFKDWKHCQRSFSLHENSASHMENSMTYRTRQNSRSTVDAGHLKQHKLNMQYWRDVLDRVVSVIKFLAKRGLAFRGSNEVFGSEFNGNYLGIIELLAQYDPFLAKHIENYGNKGKGIFLR